MQSHLSAQTALAKAVDSRLQLRRAQRGEIADGKTVKPLKRKTSPCLSSFLVIILFQVPSPPPNAADKPRTLGRPEFFPMEKGGTRLAWPRSAANFGEGLRTV